MKAGNRDSKKQNSARTKTKHTAIGKKLAVKEKEIPKLMEMDGEMVKQRELKNACYMIKSTLQTPSESDNIIA